MMMEDPNSKFFDEWPDQRLRARRELHAREVYDLMKDMRVRSLQAHVEYGKWLIASMLAIHGGSIYVLNSLKSGASAELLRALEIAAMLNIAGIAAIMLAGFLAWLNFQIAANSYDTAANPEMLYFEDAWPDFSKVGIWINLTLYGCGVVGILSWICFIGAAIVLFRAL